MGHQLVLKQETIDEGMNVHNETCPGANQTSGNSKAISVQF